jgi:hypothetical protein
VLTTSSEPRAEQLRELHKGKQVVAITLGYDEKEYADTEMRSGRMYRVSTPLTEKFTITYTGLIYPGKQNPIILLDALSRLLGSCDISPDDFEVRLYGDSIPDSVIQSNLWRIVIVKQYGKVSHAEAVRAQKASQLLWLLDWDDPDELGVHPGKIFEYLGARRPIITTGGVKGNVVDELIKETCSGYHAVDVVEVEQVLLKCYREWKQTGRVEYHGVGGERYTFKEMARKYVELLNG